MPSNPIVADSAIAIVGMAGRFPGARDVDTFFQNLCDGVESIRELTDAELEALAIPASLKGDPSYVRAAAVLDDMDRFDAAFFGFSPREAELMDPQHRIFLECCWEALERAGYAPGRMSSAVGVFGGASTNTYLLYNLVSRPELLAGLGDLQIDVGNGAAFMSSRVAYKLDLRGPCLSVETACSTSLVATHMACQSLLAEECDIALAGGVAIHVKHPEGYRYQPGGILSPDGHCRAFDARAQGTVFSSGAGVVVLKRLGDALEHGDHIHALILGSAVNNDGSRKVGYTAPSVDGQAAVIREALAVAGAPPESIDYIETHGTGTQLGDPIEIRALTRGLRPRGGAARPRSCLIGALKTNVGHLASAAGVAGVIKTALALEHRRIPPSLHFESPNPEIDFSEGRFEVNTSLHDWPQKHGVPRRAGVSSFGVGGTNAHVVLEEAPEREPSGPSRPEKLILLSARTPEALSRATENLASTLASREDMNLADVAYTLALGRSAMAERCMLVCRDREDALLGLRDPSRLTSGAPRTEDGQVAFLFPGQGAQYVDMARGIYDAEPLFREQIDACAKILERHLGLDIRPLLYPDPARAEEAARSLGQTDMAQPAIFIVAYALAKLWISWGIEPAAMLGHSVGEYVAACLAGVFSLEAALGLVAARGALMQSLPPGAMLGVELAEDELGPELGPSLAIAAVNGPKSTVVSGPVKEIEVLEARLAARGASTQRLHTSHAFHSAMMDPIIALFAERVKEARPASPRIPFVSSVTGALIEPAEATDPAYWARQARLSVRFDAGLASLLQKPIRILLEVGPGTTLRSLARARAKDAGALALASTRHPRDAASDLAVLFSAVGRLWLEGKNIDWPAFYARERRSRLPLPTYPFERRRYWIDARAPIALPPGAESQEQKVDIAESPPPRAATGAYIAPRSDLERTIAQVWQSVLGVEKVGIHDDFFELGGHSLLATQMRNQIHAALGVDLPLRNLFETRTVAAIAARIEQDAKESAAEAPKPIAERLRAAFPTERQGILEEYLRRVIARGQKCKVEELPQDGSLEGFDLHLLGAELEYDLRQDFKFQLYPHEIRGRASIPDLARFLLAEMDHLANPLRHLSSEPLSAYRLEPYRKRSPKVARPERVQRDKIPGMVFVHSSPRAGSTLLRVMLAGHPGLFCPPEINLLFFEDMKEWRGNIGFGHEMEWTTGGMQWAFMELLGLDSAHGKELIDELVAKNASASEVYARLAALASPRLFVDKTPSYALDLDTLLRAEELFDAPKYVYLYRHPYPVMESILRMRFDRLFGPSLFGDAEVDPHVVAETVWALCNKNLIELSSRVGQERCHWLRYEDLVSDPERVMKNLCTFLGVPFNERVLAPYDGKRERMMGGLGDPNIMQHKGIESKLGEAHKRIKWPRPLDPSTISICQKLGYELPEGAMLEPPATKATISPEEAERLLANMDQLSDEEVAALLEQVSAEKE